MEKRDAWLAYMRAIIRAQDSRHMLVWSTDDLLQAYIVAQLPGISLAEFCRQLEWVIDAPTEAPAPIQDQDPDPDDPQQYPEAINAAAILSLKDAAKAGHPFKIEEKPAEGQ